MKFRIRFIDEDSNPYSQLWYRQKRSWYYTNLVIKNDFCRKEESKILWNSVYDNQPSYASLWLSSVTAWKCYLQRLNTSINMICAYIYCNWTTKTCLHLDNMADISRIFSKIGIKHFYFNEAPQLFVSPIGFVILWLYIYIYIYIIYL